MYNTPSQTATEYQGTAQGTDETLVPATPEDHEAQNSNEDGIAPNVKTVKLNVPEKPLPAIAVIKTIETKKKKKTKGKKVTTRGKAGKTK